jgi:hypothetical protein
MAPKMQIRSQRGVQTTLSVAGEESAAFSLAEKQASLLIRDGLLTPLWGLPRAFAFLGGRLPYRSSARACPPGDCGARTLVRRDKDGLTSTGWRISTPSRPRCATRASRSACSRTTTGTSPTGTRPSGNRPARASGRSCRSRTGRTLALVRPDRMRWSRARSRGIRLRHRTRPFSSTSTSCTPRFESGPALRVAGQAGCRGQIPLSARRMPVSSSSDSILHFRSNRALEMAVRLHPDDQGAGLVGEDASAPSDPKVAPQLNHGGLNPSNRPSFLECLHG